MRQIAIKSAEKYSFIKNQTYPRPGHNLSYKRLDPIFTFCSIIVSLRCTLETEILVTDKLIEWTHGCKESLYSINEDDLIKIIKPAGMSEKKAKWIIEGIPKIRQIIDSNYGLRDLDSLRKEVLKIKGMGPKATDCFILLGLDLPVFPIDVNVFNITVNSIPIFKSDMKFDRTGDVKIIKKFYESEFTPNYFLYQVLHTFILLANKHKLLEQ